MMRSLYSAISGLKNHQTRMDVIGNNIANVNTVGYKTSRTIFQDIFSQTAAAGTANQGFIGGTNPIQIGLGIKLATIDVLHTPAPFQRTDNPFDMMIEGDGFFILMTEVDGVPNYYYTRAGNFYLDNEGYLVSSHGYYVMGYTLSPEYVETDGMDWTAWVAEQITLNGGTMPTWLTDYITAHGDPPDIYPDEYLAQITPGHFEFVEPMSASLNKIQLRFEGPFTDGFYAPTDPEYDVLLAGEYKELNGFSVGQDGSVSVILDNVKVTIAYLGVSMFSNVAGLEKAGNSLYRETTSSGEAQWDLALKNGAGRVNGGGLEMSNVDLATEFTDMIVTQRGFQANSRVITVSDTLLEELVNLKR